METYIAQLVGPSGVLQRQEFSALDDESAYREADNLDPLSGRWVDVRRKPDTQLDLGLER